MWTEAHRARHDARLKEIVSLHADGQIARWLERADPPRSGRATPYGAVVRAIAWHLRIGGPWRGRAPRGGPCRQAGRPGAPYTVGFANGWSWGCSTACWRMSPADAAERWGAGPSPA